jgi:hypothetical protein
VSGVSERSIDEFTKRLFALPEKWGWEYREPAAARRSPEWDREPLWVEPTNAPAVQRRPQVSGKKVAVVVVVLLIGLALRTFGILLDLVAIGLAALWFLPFITNAQKTQFARGSAKGQRDKDHARYTEDWQAWRASVETWNAGEKARIDQADLWFPVTTEQAVSRIDVFGGTSDGWAALATTLGASLLTAGQFVLLLDLSEQDVSSDLVDMARLRGIPADVLDFPSENGYAGMLRGLGSEAVAEILAEAVNTAREAASAELRSLDAALVRCVTDRLDGDLSFGRIGAGLQVLRRSYDRTGFQDPPLTESELLSLSAYVDAAGQDDQTQRELQFLINSMELLAGQESVVYGRASSGGFWPHGALVLRSSHHNSRRKDLADRVLVQILLHQLRLRGESAGHGGGSLIIVGCDHIGLRPLESLAQLARRANLKTVLVLEHLRGDLMQLLGGSDSASLIMRMGNAQEAAAAAEHIGRGHKFVMNQISRQLSEAATEGESKQWGATGTVTNSHSKSGGHTLSDLGPGTRTRGWSHSTSFSRSDTWSRTVNWSTTNTVTDGATVSRVYEFAIEPTQIQAMPTTAFIFVGSAGGQRRVVAGDCNPGICLLDRVCSIDPAQSVPRPAVEIGGGQPRDEGREPPRGAAEPERAR